MFVAYSHVAFGSENNHSAYDQCIALKKGNYTEKTMQKICSCYAAKATSFLRGLVAEGMAKEGEEEDKLQLDKKYSDEFFRVCLFASAPKDELEANGIRISGR
jgi:hypothetical protein